MNAPATEANQAGRYLLRPAQAGDLPGLLRLASQRAIGISSLPLQRDALRERIESSALAFASDDAPSGDETYLFVLEDRAAGGELIGTAGIAAAAGFHDRFYAYRNEFVVQASTALGARNRIHTLHLCHDLTGVTLLTGFHIQVDHAHTLAPQLLSRGRLMFIAAHPERFSERIAAENPGIADDSGRCPFGTPWVGASSAWTPPPPRPWPGGARTRTGSPSCCPSRPSTCRCCRKRRNGRWASCTRLVNCPLAS